MTSFKSELAKGQRVINAFASHDVAAACMAALIKDLIAHFSHDNAKQVSAAIDHAIAAKMKRKKARSITAPRGSELRGLLKCRQWDCYGEVFDVLIAEKASRYDCVNVSNWLRSKKANGANVDAEGGECPSRADIIAVMRKGVKRTPPAARKALTPLQQMKADPCGVHENMTKLASTFASVVKDSDAQPHITALCKALKTLRVFVVAAAAEAKAK